MARFRFHYAELFLLSGTIIGALVPLFGPLTVSLRLDPLGGWTELSIMMPLTVMNILIALSWLLLIAVSTAKSPKAHSELAVRLGLRKLIYFVLLVATIILFWPILIRALSPRPDYFWIYPPESPDWGLVRPSAGVIITLIYFFYILIANISVWSFGHFRRLRIANLQQR
ncbi:MAG: hypothetical protein ACFE7E_08605 [Candidatus Hodarchaeota archaeon]